MGFFDRPITSFESSLAESQKREREQVEARRAELAGYAKVPGPVRRDDEEPVLWGVHDRMPATPASEYALDVAPSIPVWISHPMDPEFERRNVYWKAFAHKAADLRQRHDRMRPALDAYRVATDDEQLNALDIGDNKEKAHSDVPSRGDRKRLPNRGGTAVRDLYDGNKLRLDPADRKAIDSLAHRVAEGTGGVEEAGNTTRSADDRLVQARQRLEGARREVSASANTLEGERRLAEASALERRAMAAQKDIDDINERLALARAIVSAMKNAASAAFHISKGEYGDALDKIGDVADSAIEITGTIVVGNAQEKLEDIRISQSVLVDQARRLSFNAAVDNAAKAQHLLHEAQFGLRVATREQQGKYNAFAATAVAQLPGHDEGTKRHLAAILSAIPTVAVVQGRASDLAAMSAKLPIDQVAMRGLGIAVAHQYPAAEPFRAAADELRTVESIARADERKWRTRLDQLFVVKNRVMDPDVE